MSLIISNFKVGSVDFSRNSEFDFEFFKKNFKFKDLDLVKEHDVILSSDHSNSYFLLKRFHVDGLVVVDQHIDLYDLKGLNKANVFKRCFDEKLIKFVIFVGARESEREEFKFERDIYNFEIIKSKNFNCGVINALEILNDKGFKNIAIDIDLDVFDSDIIKGVEYCKENLKNAIDEKIKKIIKKQLNEKGFDINVDINKIKKYAIENDLNIVYWHITEFEPRFDDGRTLNLVKGLIS